MLKMETMKWVNTKIRVSCADVFSSLLCVGGDSRCVFPIYICNRSSSDFGNFFASYLDYRACTLLIDLLRRTTIASHSIPAFEAVGTVN